MRLTLLIYSLILVIILGGTFLFVKFTPPLEIETIALSDDEPIALIGIGSKGFSNINLTEVLVNTVETPEDVKVQESNLINGFSLTDNYNHKGGKEINFKILKKLI